MRSPAEFYLRFLISRPDWDPEEVRRECRRLRLSLPSVEYLEQLRENLQPFPAPYRPESRRAKKTERWLEENGILDAWRQTEGFQQAIRVLEIPALRELVEAVILSRLPVEEFREDLPEWLEDDGFQTYGHFFFCVNLLETPELEALVESAGGLRKLAFFVDPDSTVVKALLRFRMRRDTLEVPMSVIAKKTIDIAASCLLELSTRRGSKDGSLTARRYGDLLQIGQRLLAESGAAAEDLIEIFTQFSIGHGDEPEHVGSFEQVTGQEYKPK